jgi:hypothetical protein
MPAYKHIYPSVTAEDLFDMAYYFSFDYERPPASADCHQTLRNELVKWNQQSGPPVLLAFIEKDHRTIVVDTRAHKTQVTVLGLLLARVLKSFDKPVRRDRLLMRFVEEGYQECAVDKAIEFLIANGILLLWEGELVRVATRINPLHTHADVAIAILVDALSGTDSGATIVNAPSFDDQQEAVHG